MTFSGQKNIGRIRVATLLVPYKYIVCMTLFKILYAPLLETV